jgi:hypothetical protein
MIMDKLGKFTYPALLALLLTATFAGCRQEPLPATGNVIQFSVGSEGVLTSSTKATLTDQDYLVKVDNEVMLYASHYVAGSDEKTSLFESGKAALTCKSVSGTGTEMVSTWEYAPLRYWDKRFTYDFRAVFPADKAASTSSAGQIDVNYDSASGYDLMVASVPGVIATEQIGKSVKLKFRHACAAVRILFEDVSGNTTPNYYINSFELQKLYPTGTLGYKGNSASNEVTFGGSDGEWQYTGTRANVFSWEAISGVSRWPVPADDFATINDVGWYYIIPQELDDTTILQFTYTVGNEDNAQVIPVTLPLKTSEISSWMPGQTYTYKIQLKANAIGFTVGIGDWGESVGVTYEEVG